MKKELSAIDVHFLVKELKKLEHGLVDKIYQKGEDIYIRVYAQNVGKVHLIITKRLLFLSEKKQDVTTLPHFSALLRKYLSRARIAAIDQLPGQRIIRLTCEKENKFYLYVELFNKGNTIFCDENDIIIGVLERQIWKDRRIAPKEKYIVAERKTLITLSQEEVAHELLSLDENISKKLAMSIGKRYAEEVCARAGVDPKAKTINAEEAKKTSQSLLSIFNEPLSPTSYLKDGEVVDITPFPFVSYSLESEQLKTFSEAFAEQYAKEHPEAETTEDKRIRQIEKRIQMQKDRALKLQKSVDENTRKGELLYENYAVVQEILEGILKAREKLSWKEIEEKLKDHPIVKRINSKTGEITLEL